MNAFRCLILSGVLITLSACGGANSMYLWNGYSNELLSYYKNAGGEEKFAERLLEDIEKAEAKDQVPPGLYAEYGYMMLQLGDANTAVTYFAKERDKWPESAFLMNGVISRVGPVSATSDSAAE